ncbi:MAG: hypothetical protein ABI464_15155 [Chthoniobacteraceae bacterium]
MTHAHGIRVKKLPVNSPGEFEEESTGHNSHVVKAVIGEVGE